MTTCELCKKHKAVVHCFTSDFFLCAYCTKTRCNNCHQKDITKTDCAKRLERTLYRMKLKLT